MTDRQPPIIRHEANQYLLCDATRAESVTPAWFDPAAWQTHATVERADSGRGSAWLIHAQEQDYVLRHYRRGGLATRWLQDRYFWLGIEATRAWREWRLLKALHQQGLPVPEPIAARAVRRGMFYTADILMQRIAESVALSALLQYRQLDAAHWRAIGYCIRRFHDQQVNHADLNAHNILLTAADQIYLIDFDKGQVDMGRRWQAKNLQRLLRSLNKLQLEKEPFYFTASDWDVLLAGYAAGC